SINTVESRTPSPESQMAKSTVILSPALSRGVVVLSQPVAALLVVGIPTKSTSKPVPASCAGPSGQSKYTLFDAVCAWQTCKNPALTLMVLPLPSYEMLPSTWLAGLGDSMATKKSL